MIYRFKINNEKLNYFKRSVTESYYLGHYNEEKQEPNYFEEDSGLKPNVINHIYIQKFY